MEIIKVKINDVSNLRDELNTLYDKATHKQVAKFSMLLARYILKITSFQTNEVLEEGFDINEAWQKELVRMHDVRQAAFKIHKLARESDNEVSKLIYRTIGQAVASGHMKEHGMVASDYAIKLINIIYPNNLEKVREERMNQISFMKSVL